MYCVMLFRRQKELQPSTGKVYQSNKVPVSVSHQSCPVMNFNEWHKTRGQSLHFPIILELILCLT